jgi:hypothetical protein
METPFDALNPGNFASFSDEKIRLIKKKYIKIAFIVGITGLILGGWFVYEMSKDDKD